MKLTNLATPLVTIGFTLVSFAQKGSTPAAAENVHYSGSELRQLEREAHTPEQYHALASFFLQQQESYRLQAAEEKQEWERRSVNVSGPAAKPPSPVDSAKSLYEYYAYRADNAGSLASHYQELERSPSADHHN